MKKISIVILEIVILLLLNITVYAIDGTKINIAIPESAKKGEKIQVTLMVENATNGISGIQGTLEYDESKFEYVESNILIDGWLISGFNKETGVFLLEPTNVSDTSKYINGTKNVMQISLKIKENINEEEASVKISNIVLSGEESTNKEISKTLKIIESNANNEQTEVNENNNNKEENKTENKEQKKYDEKNNNKTTIINTNTNNYKTANNDESTTKNGVIPNAGLNNNLTIIITIIAIILPFIIHTKLKKYKGI